MNIENLEKALKAGGYDSTPKMPTLMVEEIDISSWTEFWDFFDKPLSRSTIFQTPGVDGAPGLILPVAFLSAVSASREKAIKQLRNDLYKLMGPQAVVVAFLAKPSVLELASYPREGEIPDTTMTVDLRGGVPAKRRYAAFCFLHGYRNDIRLGAYPANLDERSLKELGITTAVREGEVGSDIDLQAPLEMLGTDLIAPDTDLVDDAVQEQLYPLPPMPPGEEVVLLKPNNKTEMVITNLKDPVQTIAHMHPEFKAAADKHGIDLSKAPGRELEQMRKFFAQGSGLYMVNVNFQLARTEAFKLDERAQKKIAIALRVKKPKRKPKIKKVPAKKKRTKVRRPSSGRG